MKSERGFTTVEFALNLVPLMMIVLVVLDFSRAIWEYNAISEMARAGARYAVVHGNKSSAPAGPGSNDAAVIAAAMQLAVAIDRNLAIVTSNWPDGNNGSGNRVRVDVSYQYQSLTGTLLPFANVALSASSTMIIAN